MGGHQQNFLEASWGQGSEEICYGGGGGGGVSGIPVHPSDSLRRSPCVVTDPGDTTVLVLVIHYTLSIIRRLRRQTGFLNRP